MPKPTTKNAESNHSPNPAAEPVSPAVEVKRTRSSRPLSERFKTIKASLFGLAGDAFKEGKEDDARRILAASDAWAKATEGAFSDSKAQSDRQTQLPV